MCDENLSAYCKRQIGIDAKGLSEKTGIPRRTLYDWWKNRRNVLDLIIDGIKYRKDQN